LIFSACVETHINRHFSKTALQNHIFYIGVVEMEALGAMGFVFGMMGMVAFVRTQKLIKTLKENGVLDKDYKSE
jgi:hypothetical protein